MHTLSFVNLDLGHIEPRCNRFAPITLPSLLFARFLTDLDLSAAMLSGTRAVYHRGRCSPRISDDRRGARVYQPRFADSVIRSASALIQLSVVDRINPRIDLVFAKLLGARFAGRVVADGAGDCPCWCGPQGESSNE